MERITEKFKAALDVFRTMLEKAGLREGVKVADDLLKELEEHHIASPTIEQTELWKEKIARIILKHVKGSLNPIGIIGEDIAAKEIIETIEREYSLTRKQEVPEAVEFAEWIAQKHYYKDVHKEWYGCERGMTVLIAKTTAELFQLFKNRS